MSCDDEISIILHKESAYDWKQNGSSTFLCMVAGIAVAFITAKLLRRFYFKEDETPFVMELPPYRIPTFKATCRHMWNKAEQYLRKM